MVPPSSRPRGATRRSPRPAPRTEPVAARPGERPLEVVLATIFGVLVAGEYAYLAWLLWTPEVGWDWSMLVPLLFVGFEAWENLQLSSSKPWVQHYRWPIYFFVAVAFWNLVGADIFGFMINPPIALYYMQGLNTTAVHAHGALYGVYGTLGLGLMLFCLRAMKPELEWKEKPIWFAFWAINIGMFLEIVLSLLPVGLMQTYESISVGYWSARSSEFMQTDLMQTLRWMRMVGDTIFALGAVVFCYFALDLMLRHPDIKPETEILPAVPEAA